MADQMGFGGRMRIRITQDAFDDAVKETMDDFDMEFEEAVQETIEQFMTQGVDLGGLRLDDPAVRLDQGKALRNAIGAIREAIERIEKGGKVADEKETLMESFAKTESEIFDEEKRNEACSHGAVPILSSVLVWCLSDQQISQEAMKVMGILFKTMRNREAFSQAAVNSVISAIGQHPGLKISGFKLLSAACYKDEPNKNRVETADSRYSFLNNVLADADTPTVKAACELVRRLVTRDDTREMMDNCFNRSKALKNFGVLGSISKLLSQYKDDMETMPAILACLANTCLQQDTIDVLVSNNMVQLSIDLLKTHMDLQTVAENAISMVAALAQSDKPKRIIGQGEGLGLIMTALDKYRSSGRTVLRALKGIGHLLLRESKTSTKLAEMGGIPLILDVARMYSCITPDRKAQSANAKIQCSLMLLIRNMVSHNKELIKPWIEEDVEEQIRIESVHPDVNASAFSTLKELECKVELKEEWNGVHGDIFKQGDGGEVSSQMKEFLSEYRDTNATNMIDQAGMSDKLDVNTLPKMGGTNTGEDKPQIDDCCDSGCCH